MPEPFVEATNYRVQSGCFNCKHRWKDTQYEGDVFYCMRNNTAPEPEYPIDAITLEEYGKYYEAHINWTHGRDVKTSGICDHWAELIKEQDV
jgi:hypothetical protein